MGATRFRMQIAELAANQLAVKPALRPHLRRKAATPCGLPVLARKSR